MGIVIGLLRESVLVQALITLVLVVATSVMAVRGQNPPEWLVQALMLILGFYFGSKTERAVSRYVHR